MRPPSTGAVAARKRRLRANVEIAALVALGGSLAVLGVSCTSAFDWSCRQDSTCRPPGGLTVTTSGGDGGGTGAGGDGAGSGGGGGASPCAESPLDPADGPIDPQCALWVSSSLGNDANPGTQAQPVRTLSHAILLAQSGAHRIYACAETYVEEVRLPAGVSLFGGFSACDQLPWTYEGNKYPARLAPGQPGLIALTLIAGGGMSFVGDVWAQSASAVKPGGSSIAAFAMDDAHATFRRTHFEAGNGADGADGQPGSKEGQAAQKGLSGLDGTDACTMDPGAGGEAITLNCPDGTTSIGGVGGDGGELAANGGGTGEHAPSPNPAGFGAGGKAEDGGAKTPCTGGISGAKGIDGTNGDGGASLGQLTADGQILGGAGAIGTPGAPGQGGGGGGASLGSGLCGAAPHGGAGGGSGGTGGCGGKGGQGGQAGGSSIGLAARGVDVHFDGGIVILYGNGGKGGNGGVLQAGGQAGLPGLGGWSGINGVAGGCVGGGGGQGGKGGNGGGGRGGHAVALGLTSNAIPLTSYASSGGVAGLGGAGGDPLVFSTYGKEGQSGYTVWFDP